MLGGVVVEDPSREFGHFEPCGGSGTALLGRDATITIRSRSGELLAWDQLRDGLGRADGRCHFAFVLRNLPDEARYVVDVAGSGQPTLLRTELSKGELARRRWILTLEVAGPALPG
jgi:hypothetical protein